jgi:hypothetical protein
MKMGTIVSSGRYDAASNASPRPATHARTDRRFYDNRDSSIWSGHPGSRHFECWNGLDLLSELLLGAMQIVPLLQIEPEIGTVSTQLPKP